MTKDFHKKVRDEENILVNTYLNYFCHKDEEKFELSVANDFISFSTYLLNKKNISDETYNSILINLVIYSRYWKNRILLNMSKNKKTILRSIKKKNYTPGLELGLEEYTRHYLYSMKREYSINTYKQIFETYGYEPEQCKCMIEGSFIYADLYFTEFGIPRKAIKKGP
jgi:hypothetical protein